MNNDQLDSMTDAELSQAVAVECAGYGLDADGWFVPPLPRRIALLAHELPDFATSADAVLPLINAVEYQWSAGNDGVGSTESCWCNVTTRHGTFKGWQSTFARAACIALLRAKRAGKGAA